MAAKQPAGSESKIYSMRGQQVMLSVHLAKMHRISTQVLEQVVERNLECFPGNSLFRLRAEEFAGLKLPPAHADLPLPYAFTGQAVAILSSLLFDERAEHEKGRTRSSACRCHRK